MDKNTGEEERRKIVKELGNYRRVVVCITVQDKEAGEYRSFFAGFRPQAPVVYAFFTSYAFFTGCGSSAMNMASPKEKNLYLSLIASLYAAKIFSLPANALTNITSVDSGK